MIHVLQALTAALRFAESMDSVDDLDIKENNNRWNEED